MSHILRLKQMVADKMAASRRGKTTNITGQPAQGRSAVAVFVSNMESDAITANGMMSFLKESLIERSDGPAFPVHMIQGHHDRRRSKASVSRFQAWRSLTRSRARFRRRSPLCRTGLWVFLWH
jgi:DNA-directed RNA polymerase beta subunit